MTGETTTAVTGRRAPRMVRIMRTRPRLFLSGMFGLAVIAFLFATSNWRIATNLLVGWDIGIGLYLILAFRLMARSDVHRLRRRAANQDEGNSVILVLTVAAAIASLGAIFSELGTVEGAKREAGQLILASATVVLSWAFIHSIFALHYAHEFYGDGRDHRTGGMLFPDDQDPDYWDFTYFAFTVGMCAQVSDVTVSSKAIRRTVLAHSVISFLFNVTLVAITVSIAASAI